MAELEEKEGINLVKFLTKQQAILARTKNLPEEGIDKVLAFINGVATDEIYENIRKEK